MEKKNKSMKERNIKENRNKFMEERKENKIKIIKLKVERKK